MIHFVYPYLFWILVVPFIVFAILVSTNKDKIERLFSGEILKRLEVNGDYLPLKIRNIIFFFAILLMMVALSRPVMNDKEHMKSSSGIHAIMAIDISGSMRSSDNYPNRLEFAKQKAKKLLEQMSSDEVFLIAFASNAFVVSPYTNDIFALSDMIDGLSDKSISNSATNYDSLAELIVDISTKEGQKIAIIISDGGDEKELATFREKMKSNNIQLFVILVGTSQGSLVLDKNNQPIMLQDGTMAITKQNDTIGKIAINTHGAYIKATYNNSDIVNLAKKIHSSTSSTFETSRKIVEYTELFYIPLAFSIFLLLLSFISLPNLDFKKKIKK